MANQNLPRRVVVNLAELGVTRPVAAADWVLPATVRAEEAQAACATLGELRVDALLIEQLRERLALEMAALRMMDSWPRVAADRKVLEAASTLAAALALVLTNASPRAHAEIATAALIELGDANAAAALAEQLAALSNGLSVRAAKLPPQSRRAAPVQLVHATVQVLGEALMGKPSTREDSSFRRVCEAAFTLAGYPFSPDRAIRSYMNSKRSKSKR